MFENAKVGDRVWSIQQGWGTIVNTTFTELYPILVNFGYKTSMSYTNEGKVRYNDISPSLFWNEFKVPEEAYKKPLPKLEVDTKVLVWDSEGGPKKRRYFSHFDSNGKIRCFMNGATSWSANHDSCTVWKNWELYKEPLDDKDCTFR